MTISRPRWDRLAPALIVLVVFAAFLPSCLSNGFVKWDDGIFILTNRSFRGLGWSNIRWMFASSPLLSVYQPVSWLTLGLDYCLWGMDPRGYHLTSLLWHAANALLFYLVCAALLRAALPAAKARPGLTTVCSAFAALLFAVHPLRVESVAWVSERRDVVSGFFYLAALLAYLRAWAEPSRRVRWLAAGIAAFSVSLLSKPIGVSLPLTLLILDVYPLRRLPIDPREWWTPEGRRVLLEKAAFAVPAAAGAVLTLSISHSTGAVADLVSRRITVRLAQAVFGLAFYVRKTFVPLDLSPLYVFSELLDPFEGRFLLSGVAVAAAAAALAWLAWRRRLALPAAGLHYAASLAPVLGLVVLGPQLVADRYSYLSCLGIPILLAGAVLGSQSDQRRRAGVLAMGLAVSGLAALTWRQTRVWHDTVTLWRHALAIDPDNHGAHHNLALALREMNDLKTAMVHEREALRIAWYYVSAHIALCGLMPEENNQLETINHCVWRHALAINPDNHVAHHNLAVGLHEKNDRKRAIEHEREALRLSPDYVDAHVVLCALLSEGGGQAEAISHCMAAIRLDPRNPDAHVNLGAAQLRLRQFDGAESSFRMVLRLKPDNVPALCNLGYAFLAQGRWEEAAAIITQGLLIDPNNPLLIHGLRMARARVRPRLE